MVKFPDKKIGVSGGPLKEKWFLFSQMHFHWSSKNDDGSEHTINGKHFAMEVIYVLI